MTETLQFYITDHLQSRIVVLNASGAVEETISYSSWGVSSSSVNGANSPNASFTGKKADASGLYYFNARYYDSVVGKFLMEDSLRSGVNWYVYCVNDPINIVDTTGRDPKNSTYFDWYYGALLGPGIIFRDDNEKGELYTGPKDIAFGRQYSDSGVLLIPFAQAHGDVIARQLFVTNLGKQYRAAGDESGAIMVKLNFYGNSATRIDFNMKDNDPLQAYNNYLVHGKVLGEGLTVSQWETGRGIDSWLSKSVFYGDDGFYVTGESLLVSLPKGATGLQVAQALEIYYQMYQEKPMDMSPLKNVGDILKMIGAKRAGGLLQKADQVVKGLIGNNN
jgi:RHS repeat-associated protein